MAEKFLQHLPFSCSIAVKSVKKSGKSIIINDSLIKTDI